MRNAMIFKMVGIRAIIGALLIYNAIAIFLELFYEVKEISIFIFCSNVIVTLFLLGSFRIIRSVEIDGNTVVFHYLFGIRKKRFELHTLRKIQIYKSLFNGLTNIVLFGGLSKDPIKLGFTEGSLFGDSQFLDFMKKNGITLFKAPDKNSAVIEAEGEVIEFKEVKDDD